MALGADLVEVRNMVMRQGMKLVLIGGTIGVLAAAAASRMITIVLYGVSVLDIEAYAAGLAIMIAVAFLASYLPARRATRVNPAIVLRCE
jgi:ABC-type antimicrobial peptide transport system permease subunit